MDVTKGDQTLTRGGIEKPSTKTKSPRGGRSKDLADDDAQGPLQGGTFAKNSGADVRGIGRSARPFGRSSDPSPETSGEALVRALDEKPGAFLVQTDDWFGVTTSKRHPRGQGVELPDFEFVADRSTPTVAKMRANGNSYAVVIPPGFNAWSGSRTIRIVAAPPGRLHDVVSSLARSKSKTYVDPNELIIVADRKKLGAEPKERVQRDFRDIGGVLFDISPHVVELQDKARGWVRSIRPKKSAGDVGDAKAAVEARWKYVTDTRRHLLATLASLHGEPGAISLLETLVSEFLPDKPGDQSRLDRYEGDASDFKERVERLAARLELSVGTSSEFVAPKKVGSVYELSFPEYVESTDQNALAATHALAPELCAGLQLLMDERPDLFRSKDIVTGRRFSETIKSYVEDGLAKDDLLGLGQFFVRLANRDFRGHVGGWSHTHGVAKGIVMTHPGLILDLARASKEGRPYKVDSVYPGDGATQLEPCAEFRYPFDRARMNCVGYEMGLLYALVNDLAPDRIGEVHPDLVKGRSPRAAIGAAKLTGQPFRYNYADRIRTGEDLVEAMSMMPDYGVAMGDIIFEGPAGYFRTHFGYFSDFDPESRTVCLDDFCQRSRRVEIDGMHFRGTVACYHTNPDGFKKFLTPEKETRYGETHPETRRTRRPPL